jgi:zinc protease
MSHPTPSAVPPLTAPRRARKLTSAERVLPTGLRAVAVRKPGIPLVEVRLRVPFLVAAPSHPARAVLLSDAVLTGTAEHDRTGLAAAVQALGGELSVGVDADRLLVSGHVLATNLRPLLALVASVLETATYPAAEVATERDRLVEKLKIARSQAGVLAAEARAHRMWGEHPYARELPEPEAVDGSAAAPPARRPGAARRRDAGARRGRLPGPGARPGRVGVGGLDRHGTTAPSAAVARATARAALGR